MKTVVLLVPCQIVKVVANYHIVGWPLFVVEYARFAKTGMPKEQNDIVS